MSVAATHQADPALTHTEIATALGLPAGTAKGRRRLGLNKLREAIDLIAA